MAEASQEQNRNEEATPFKLDQARKKGMVARGTDLGFLAVLIGFAIAAQLFGAALIAALAQSARRSLAQLIPQAHDPTYALAAFGGEARTIVTVLVIPLLVIMIIAVLIEVVQIRGIVLSTTPLIPDFSRLNPAKGLKRLLSLRMLKELAKNLFKFALYGAASLLFIRYAARKAAMHLGDASQLARALGHAAGQMLLLFIILAAIAALLDQLLARREFAKQMRMSRRDVVRETREREGEPRQKQKRKQIFAEILKQASAAADIKGADVLIVNPTHYAVALRYRPGETDAPLIQARGRNAWALRMRQRAQREGITIVRNPSLARALFHEGRIGHQIGSAHFVAAADIYIMLRRALQQSTPRQLQDEGQ